MKKPVSVRRINDNQPAIQIKADNLDQVADFAQGNFEPYTEGPDDDGEVGILHCLYRNTERAYLGDWVTRTGPDQYQLIDADEFADQYAIIPE